MYAFCHVIYLFELTLYFIVSKRKRPRCGDCDGCQVSEDCGTCSNCLDKPKIGGAGGKKQCVHKEKMYVTDNVDISTFIMGFIIILSGALFTAKNSDTTTQPTSLETFSARAFALVNSE